MPLFTYFGENAIIIGVEAKVTEPAAVRARSAASDSPGMPGDRSIKGFIRRASLRSEVELFLRGKLDERLVLDVFGTESSKDVFRARLGDGTELFVKVAPGGQCARRKALADDLDLPFIARVRHIFPWREEWSVICIDWQKGRHVPLEEANDRQVASLAETHLRLVAALKPEHELRPKLDGDELYATVKSFARKHPLAWPFLRSLLAIPHEDRTPDPARMKTVHGDFHYLNYLFDGDAVSAVMDFDGVKRELPAWDIAYNLLRRYYKGRLDAKKTRSLDANVRKLIALLPYPAHDWRVAFNELRLLFAARRLKAHPYSAPAAIIVWRRDRALRNAIKRFSLPD